MAIHNFANSYLPRIMKKILSILLLVLLFSTQLISQSIFDYKGYLQNTQQVWAPKQTDSWVLSGSILNRLDFFVYPASDWSVNIGMRNLIDYGQMFQLAPNYADLITTDEGYFNLTKKWADGESYVFYTNIDRLNVFYTGNNLEVQIGRQRINWGVSLVWTPNDIFNSASYLNFDYPEMPGSDAGRAQYYF